MATTLKSLRQKGSFFYAALFCHCYSSFPERMIDRTATKSWAAPWSLSRRYQPDLSTVRCEQGRWHPEFSSLDGGI